MLFASKKVIVQNPSGVYFIRSSHINNTGTMLVFFYRGVTTLLILIISF